jgi:hypothetical protein
VIFKNIFNISNNKTGAAAAAAAATIKISILLNKS